MSAAFLASRAFRVHPVDARSIALEVGILNGPLAIAIVLLTFTGTPDIGLVLIVPALYSLFIVIVSTLVTFWFRRANLRAEQKIPNLL
jgi:BASS family bile acid:Na+ symporter